MRVPRDSAFELFLLNPTLIRHLLRAYPLSGIDSSDVIAVEPANTNFVGPDLRQRLPDAVWRLRPTASWPIWCWSARMRSIPAWPSACCTRRPRCTWL